MIGNYAIKSIVLIDFIDIIEVARAPPFVRYRKDPVNLVLLATYGNCCKFTARESVHRIAVPRTKDSQARNVLCSGGRIRTSTNQVAKILPTSYQYKLCPSSPHPKNDNLLQLYRWLIYYRQAAASGSIYRIFNKLSSIINKWRSRLTVHQR